MSEPNVARCGVRLLALRQTRLWEERTNCSIAADFQEHGRMWVRTRPQGSIRYSDGTCAAVPEPLTQARPFRIHTTPAWAAQPSGTHKQPGLLVKLLFWLNFIVDRAFASRVAYPCQMP